MNSFNTKHRMLFFVIIRTLMSKERSKIPLVSVILPAYNAESYIEESIQSVLRQDFTNFEFIIINDGSTDNTQPIIDKYAKIDKRIIVIKQNNKGLVNTLNIGLEAAKGRFIARIDGDDPWLDHKLSHQVKEFEQDDSLVLIGGGFEVIDENGYYIETIFPPTTDDDIRRSLMLRNVFGHAGVMMKRDAVLSTGGYRKDFGPTEDYDLWIRLSKLGTVKNLPHPVYRYRINRYGISQTSSSIQAIETKKHIERQWSTHIPEVLKRREILSRANNYLKASPLEWYNVALKEQFLSDNAQVGIKLVRHKHFIDGIRQLFYVASTGRAGVRAVIKRIKKLDAGSFRQRQHVAIDHTEVTTD